MLRPILEFRSKRIWWHASMTDCSGWRWIKFFFSIDGTWEVLQLQVRMQRKNDGPKECIATLCRLWSDYMKNMTIAGDFTALLAIFGKIAGEQG